jgi:hypothetical protein
VNTRAALCGRRPPSPQESEGPTIVTSARRDASEAPFSGPIAISMLGDGTGGRSAARWVRHSGWTWNESGIRSAEPFTRS